MSTSKRTSAGTRSMKVFASFVGEFNLEWLLSPVIWHFFKNVYPMTTVRSSKLTTAKWTTWGGIVVLRLWTFLKSTSMRCQTHWFIGTALRMVMESVMQNPQSVMQPMLPILFLLIYFRSSHWCSSRWFFQTLFFRTETHIEDAIINCHCYLSRRCDGKSVDYWSCPSSSLSKSVTTNQCLTTSVFSVKVLGSRTDKESKTDKTHPFILTLYCRKPLETM